MYESVTECCSNGFENIAFLFMYLFSANYCIDKSQDKDNVAPNYFS